MNSDTEITKSILEVMGDNDDDGYYITIDDEIRVPIFLNKDHTTRYPEITLIPKKKKQTYVDRFLKKDLSKLLKHYGGIFEVNIYTKDLSLSNKISEELEDRILDFGSIVWSEFDYNENFVKNGDHYENICFADVDDNEYRNVFKVTINGKKLLYSNNLEEESWYSDEDTLYVKTNCSINTIKVYVLFQGRTFSNKDVLLDRNIYSCVLSDREETSETEKNEVGRKIYNLDLLFKEIKIRPKIPEVKRVGFYPHKG